MRNEPRRIVRLVPILLVVAVIIVAGYPARAGSKPLSGVAVWVTHTNCVEGIGSLEEFLLDRLGSNGLYPVCGPEQVRAAAFFVGLGNGVHFDRKRLAELGRALGCRWVVWVKVADRGVDFKKGLSVPHLFIRRKAVSRILVDARAIDVTSGRLAASRRFRLDKSGAGSYQVAEDVRQDPVYNNSANQFYQDARRLEWGAARNISCWFKALARRAEGNPVIAAEEQLLGNGPFVTDNNTELK